ncbi:unnamed protein product, partial [Sphenostylis stenocarpa]
GLHLEFEKQRQRKSGEKMMPLKRDKGLKRQHQHVAVEYSAQQTYLAQDSLMPKHAMHRTLRFVDWCNVKILQDLCPMLLTRVAVWLRKVDGVRCVLIGAWRTRALTRDYDAR